MALVKLTLASMYLSLSVVSAFSAEPQDRPNNTWVSGARAAVEGTENVWRFPQYAASCMKIEALVKRSVADLQLISEFDKYLGWVGPALGLSNAALSLYEGKNLQSVQQFGAVGADMLVCSSAPQMCPAWEVGRTIGSVVNQITSMMRRDGKDVTGMLEDFYLTLSPDAPATARNLVALVLDLKKQERRSTTFSRLKRCADPSQDRAGVDAIMKSLSPPKTELPRTPSPTSCAFLDDIAASERLSSESPDAYEALLERCLK
tara:strand:+ start:2460 stop:3242 length:783 start_codon:yes stop_codon:yes gene_type:complete